MISAQVVETSVTNNSSFQYYPHPDDYTIRSTDTPGFKPFTTWLSCLYGLTWLYISTQANVQRFNLRQYERWFQGDDKGHANHHWKTEKSSDIRRRRYRFCMAILLILSKKWNKLIMCRTAWSFFFVGMKEKWSDNTYIYSRWKTDILTHICQVLSFGGDWYLRTNVRKEIIYHPNQRPS